jgi:hypothetical protein
MVPTIGTVCSLTKKNKNIFFFGSGYGRRVGMYYDM